MFRLSPEASTSKKLPVKVFCESRSDIFSFSSLDSPSKFASSTLKKDTVVRIGTLDEDCRYPQASSLTNKASDQTDIRILVKSDIAALKLDSFDEREATMPCSH